MDNPLYYQKALAQAKNNLLSEAVDTLSISLMNDFIDERVWKLAGLCYYQLGNWRIAQYCFDHIPNNQYHLACEEYDLFLKEISLLIDQEKYKQALKYAKANHQGTLKDYQLIGCVYMLLNKKWRAHRYFKRALLMDCYNPLTMMYKKTVEKEIGILRFGKRK